MECAACGSLRLLGSGQAASGSPELSAFIVRSRRLGEGTVLQNNYDPKAKTVTQRYGPTQVPYELAG